MKYIATTIGMLPIHFGMRTIAEFSEVTGIEFNTIVAEPDKLGNIKTMAQLARFGLNEGSRREGENKRYDIHDIWDLFDDNPNMFSEVVEIFTESTIAITSRLAPPSPNTEQTPQSQQSLDQ